MQTHLSSLKFDWHIGFAQESKTRVSPLPMERQRNFRLHFYLLQVTSVDINMVSHYDKAKEREARENPLHGHSYKQNPDPCVMHATVKNMCEFF